MIGKEINDTEPINKTNITTQNAFPTILNIVASFIKKRNLILKYKYRIIHARVCVCLYSNGQTV